MRLVGAPTGRKRRSHSRDRPRYPRAASTGGARTQPDDAPIVHDRVEWQPLRKRTSKRERAPADVAGPVITDWLGLS